MSVARQVTDQKSKLSRMWHCVSWLPDYVVFQDPKPTFSNPKERYPTSNAVQKDLLSYRKKLAGDKKKIAVIKTDHFTLIKKDDLDTIDAVKKAALSSHTKFDIMLTDQLSIEQQKELHSELEFKFSNDYDLRSTLQAIQNSENFKSAKKELAAAKSSISNVETTTEISKDTSSQPRETAPLNTTTESISIDPANIIISENFPFIPTSSTTTKILDENSFKFLLQHSLFAFARRINENIDKHFVQLNDQMTNRFQAINNRLDTLETQVSALRDDSATTEEDVSDSEEENKRLFKRRCY